MSEQSAFLIIDDNSIDRMISNTLLKKCLDNPEVYAKENVGDALNWLKSERINLDRKLIILLDMRMPDVDGFGFLEEYEKLDSSITANNDIIMLSAMDESSEQTQKAKLNPIVKAVLDKPLDVDALSQVIYS